MSNARNALYSLLALAATLVLIWFVSRFFPIVDLVTSIQQRVVDLGPWGAVCYPFLFALCNLLLLPGGIITVGSGFFFGLWWGFTLVFVGNAISAAIAFAITRGVARHWIRRKFAHSPTLRALEPAIEREGWKVIFLTQLHPLFPTSLITYLYGLTRINFRTYMTWISVGRAPALFLYVYLGTLGQHGINIARGKSHPRIIEYWTWGGAFVIGAMLLIIGSRVAARAARDRDAMLSAVDRENARPAIVRI